MWLTGACESVTRGDQPVRCLMTLRFAKSDQFPTREQLRGVTHLILGELFVCIAVPTDTAHTAFVDLTVSPLAFLPTTDGPGFSATTVRQLRSLDPNLKVMAALGGWGYDKPFRPAVQNETSRAAFVKDVMTFVETMELDGIDMDWEYVI